MPPLISAHGLRKTFRVAVKEPGFVGALKHLLRPRHEERVAVEGLDFDIEASEAVAFLGSNGAGKSTTIKMLTGILAPTGGDVTVRGLVPHERREENAKNIGVIFGQRTQLWWDIPVIESLRLLADIYEVPLPRFRRNLTASIELLQIEPLLSQPPRSLSLGQRVRCDVAAALLHDPAVLFLDEPTLGLDIAVKERVRGFIREMNRERGVTVILTSHDLDDIEGLCGRLLIIDRGALLFHGSRAELDRRFPQERVVRLALSAPVPDLAARCTPGLFGGRVRIEQPGPRAAVFRFDPEETTAAAVIGAVLPLLPVEDLRVEEPGLSAIIRTLYGRSEAGGLAR